MVTDMMSEYRCLEEFSSLIHLIHEEKYPLDSLPLRLVLETARWFSCTSTTNMWYWEDTLKFWKVGYRLFGDKFVLFMSGMKSLGTVITPPFHQPFQSSEEYVLGKVHNVQNIQKHTESYRKYRKYG